LAIVKPSWLESVEHALSDACSTASLCSEQQHNQPTAWVACSGGLDSCALLDITAKWAQRNPSVKLGVIHINHQLSPYAKQWQCHVEELAASYNIEYVSKHVSVNNKSRQSLESQARDERYNAMFETLKDQDVLLLGHHLDDQVETIFMRLLRGSGPKGIAGIRALTQRSHGTDTLKLVRPLLSISRADLETYATTNGLRWVTDESNDNVEFDRNMVRHKWMKVAQLQWPERWPGMQKAIARSAFLCDQQQTALELLLADKLKPIQTSRETLLKSQLLTLPIVLQLELLRYWLTQLTHEMPSAAVLSQIQLALHCENDKSPVINWGSHECRVYGDTVYFLQHQFESSILNTELPDGEKISLQDAVGRLTQMSWQYTEHNLVLTLDWRYGDIGQRKTVSLQVFSNQLPQAITIANNVGDRYFTGSENGKSRQLKRWFKDWKIPPWYRSSVAGVFIDSTLVAVIDGNIMKPNHIS